jgi:hypothetical protein
MGSNTAITSNTTMTTTLLLDSTVLGTMAGLVGDEVRNGEGVMVMLVVESKTSGIKKIVEITVKVRYQQG